MKFVDFVFLAMSHSDHRLLSIPSNPVSGSVVQCADNLVRIKEFPSISLHEGTQNIRFRVKGL